ncbi:hypothetical protein F5Y10DRAFT_250883 [Nemania abortiva]|nr:hypothetical protein F5Y10DRAFT_250883 [Nemania abortiva]
MAKLKRDLQGIRLTSGETYGEIELPEAAKLVYPNLGYAAEVEPEETSKGRDRDGTGIKENWKTAGKFIQGYLDHQAQASCGAKTPNSRLAVPLSGRNPYTSRYSDPDHPVNNGSLISLLTGGAINRNRRRRKPGRAEQRWTEMELNSQDPQGQEHCNPPKSKKRVLGEILQENVLYLILVNLPSEIGQSVLCAENPEVSFTGQ